MTAKTSKRVSSLAGKFADMTMDELKQEMATHPNRLLANLRSMGASLLRQVEPKGTDDD